MLIKSGLARKLQHIYTITSKFFGLSKFIDQVGNTILHALASPHSSFNILNTNLQGLDVNAKNFFGDTALHLCVCKDYYEISIAFSTLAFSLLLLKAMKIL